MVPDGLVKLRGTWRRDDNSATRWCSRPGSWRRASARAAVKRGLLAVSRFTGERSASARRQSVW